VFDDRFLQKWFMNGGFNKELVAICTYFDSPSRQAPAIAIVKAVDDLRPRK
jgi:hypothetical protein